MSTLTIPTSVSVSQQNLLITTPLKRTSKVLCGFGIAEIVFSIFLFSSCIWTSSLDNEIVAPYFGFASAIFHTVLGVLAIIAARDLDRFRGCLISCLVMGIVGPCIFVVATITADSINWVNYYSCTGCYYEQQRYTANNNNIHTGWNNDYNYDWQFNNPYLSCMRRCLIPDGTLFLPILLFSIIEGIIGITLSGIACCNFTSCCTRQTPGIVNYGNNYSNHHQFNVPVLATQPQPSPQQIHVNYPPPNYSENADTSQSVIPGIHETNVVKF